MGPMMGGPDENMIKKLREPKPKSIKEVPGYVKIITSKFFGRLIYIFRLVWETKPLILFAMLLLSILGGIMPVLQTYAASFLLGDLAAAYTAATTGMGQVEWSTIILLLLAQFACIFATSLINTLNSIATKIFGELVANHVRTKIMIKSKEIDLASFDKPEFYAKLENAVREADMRPIQILNATFSVVSTAITLVSYFIVLGSLEPRWASLVVIALSVPSSVVSFIYRKKNFLYMRHRSKDRRRLSYYSDLVTDKDMVKEVRMFGLADVFVKRYKEVFTRYFSGLKGLFFKEGAWNLGFAIVSAAANCALFLIIAKQVFSGSMPIGNFSLYTGALNSVASGVASFIATTATIYEGTLFIDNLITYMNEKNSVKSTLTSPRIPVRHTGHEIRFENVSFSYPGSDREVLININAVIKPGSTVVLVGLNGAGKTTLVKLLTRLYDPTKGTIYLDGYDIKEYDVAELYKLFGIIFQDFGKYAVSVKDNITFGQTNREPDMNGVISAAKESNSDVFIDRLPKGYDTPLMKYFEDDGVELSIGQWQKLSVARAFYSDSDILILDEPTASLDAIAEQEIYSQFDLLRKDKTTIFVSHRLSSAASADKIIVLDYGTLAEEGTHSELMRLGGKYYELFSTQAKRYVESIRDSNADSTDARFSPDRVSPDEANAFPDNKLPFADMRNPSFDSNRPPFANNEAAASSAAAKPFSPPQN